MVDNDMQFTLTQFIKDTELNDFKIRRVELDMNARKFLVDLEGAYWFRNKGFDPVALEKGGIILISDYCSFEARYFCPKDKLWRTLDYKSLEAVDEISEKSYNDKVLKLAGTGKCSGYWIEYLINSGNCEIYFNE